LGGWRGESHDITLNITAIRADNRLEAGMAGSSCGS
jgi:hypothetical protein